MIVDIHARIGQHPLHEFKQEPGELIDIMDKYGIDKSFLLPFPTMDIKKNNDLIAKAVETYRDRLIGFAGFNPTTDDAADEIERAVKIGLKGIMFDPEFHKQSFRNISKVELLMVTCHEHNLPVLINTENIAILTRQKLYHSMLDRLAFKFPEIRFVVSFRWPRIEELMRNHKNIILYTGGHHNTPGIIPMLEEIGPMRICMGTESPVNHPALTIKDLRVKKIEEKYRDLILGNNAERIFKDLF